MDQEHSVKWTTTLQFVFVLLDFKAILLWLALRLVAAKTMIVPLMRNAVLFLAVATPGKNVNPFAIQATVRLAQTVQLEITGNLVPVDSHCKEMVIHLVLSVSAELCTNQNLARICMVCFVFSAVVLDDPECRVDKDCPPQMTCMRERCQNPCIVSNPCSSSQQCVVTDSGSSYRSVACICPEGTLAGYGGTCERGKLSFLLRVILFQLHELIFLQLMPSHNVSQILIVTLTNNVTKVPVDLHVVLLHVD